MHISKMKQISLNYVPLGLVVVIAVLCTGCQVWQSSSLPGLKTSSEQKKILAQLEHDPFPTPEDVGMEDE